MKLKEIRLGNLLNRNAEIDQVNGIFCEMGTNDSDYFIQAKNLLDYRLIKFTPITLSEDFLVKLGWGRSNEHELGYNYGSLDLFYDYHFKRFSIGIGDETLMLMHIKYVHQLQNLIFALTGQELEIVA